ncbi:hypothetical protein E2C01_074325 [Portunus trituberculatus]|uniref:Uncharacterized protein n=1 Tax=Portunus trituberculatus TaxID=210409 RepID=A0A5B7ID03_PORTR|nr:hypothetical protein [Portunus trituberculatus]
MPRCSSRLLPPPPAAVPLNRPSPDRFSPPRDAPALAQHTLAFCAHLSTQRSGPGAIISPDL